MTKQKKHTSRGIIEVDEKLIIYLLKTMEHKNYFLMFGCDYTDELNYCLQNKLIIEVLGEPYSDFEFQITAKGLIELNRYRNNILFDRYFKD